MKDSSSFNTTKVLLILIFICILQYFTQTPLREYSNQLTPKLQQYHTLIEYLEYPAFFGNSSAKHVTVALTFAFANNYCLFIIAFVAPMSQFLNNVEKLFFTGPRPFWYVEDIHPVVCEGSYGFPSNHTFGAAMLFFFFFRVIEFVFFKGSRVANWVLNIIWGLFVASAMVSRMATGVHSLDQLVFGLIHGSFVIYVLYCEVGLRPENEEWFKRFLNRPEYFKLSLWIAFGVGLLVTWFSAAPFEDRWINILAEKCNRVITESPFEKCFANIGNWFGALAAFLAVTARFEQEGTVRDQLTIECTYYTAEHEAVKQVNKFYILNLLIRFLFAWAEIYLILYLEAWFLKLNPSIINRFVFKFAFSRFLISYIGLRYFSKQASYLHISN